MQSDFFITSAREVMRLAYVIECSVELQHEM